MRKSAFVASMLAALLAGCSRSGRSSTTGEGTPEEETGTIYAHGAHSDIDGDGKRDLVVGALGYDTSRGRVHVFLHEIAGNVDASTADVILEGEAQLHLFGSAVLIHDVDGDGLGDVVVGAQWAGPSREGRVYVFYGATLAAAGPGAVLAAADADRILTGEAQDDRFGASVAAGYLTGVWVDDGTFGFDFSEVDPVTGYLRDPVQELLKDPDTDVIHDPATGLALPDPFADIAIGAPGANLEQGKVYVSSLLHLSEGAPSTPDDFVFYVGTAEGDGFGSDLAVGNVNGDAFDDLVAGAPGFDLGALPNVGRAYVLLGPMPGSGPVGPSAHHALDGEDEGSRFGSAVATGVIKGFLVADIVVGAPGFTEPFAQGGENAFRESGRAYVFLGSNLFSKGAADADAILTPGDSLAIQQGYTGFGLSLALDPAPGDLAGGSDVVVGAPDFNWGANPNGGRVFVFPNALFFAPPPPDGLIHANGRAYVIDADDASDSLGAAVLLCDIDGNGVADLVAGAQRRNAGAYGRLHIFFDSLSDFVGVAQDADATVDGTNPNDRLGLAVD